MTQRMLIDAAHSEEVRVAIVHNERLEELDVETSTKKQVKGNVYLAKVIRIEPSLQAAFVEFGGNRHGFLSFNDIHPDYYRIPDADRHALLASARQSSEEEEAPSSEEPGVETQLSEEDEVETARKRARLSRNYKIQDVIKRRQIMLVQVLKEERGGKGAALTTYLSLAGRYCVLMPNATRGGGVSRRIADPEDRKRLRELMEDLNVPEGMGLIIRTAGQNRSKVEIKRDSEYLFRLWDDIRAATFKSVAPALIHEESDLIKRTIRDLYTKDIEEILIEGEEDYKTAKSFMKMLMPSHAKKVQLYKAPTPLFQKYKVEEQIDIIYNPTVSLPSGGYIVLNQTEALVAIDVNSGKSTRERHIGDTALKTNLEAADEVARQLRLRDLAGLVVVDFIDMDEPRHVAAVERRLKEAVKTDRARIQVGRISSFGLLELSRQRLRSSIIETSNLPCHHCRGTGWVRSVESSALRLLRSLEREALTGVYCEVTVFAPGEVVLYILNQKRALLNSLEHKYGFLVFLYNDESLIMPEFRFERLKPKALPPMIITEALPQAIEPAETAVEDPQEIVEESSEEISQEASSPPAQKKPRRRRPERKKPVQTEVIVEGPSNVEVKVEDSPAEDLSESPEQEMTEGADASTENNRRRRRHRNWRRRRQKDSSQKQETSSEDVAVKEKEDSYVAIPQETPTSEEKPKRGWWKRLLEQ